MVLQLLHGFHAPQIVFSLKMFMSKYCIFLNQKYNPGEIFSEIPTKPSHYYDSRGWGWE